MNDGIIAKIKEVNQRLSDLVGLPYTDFYKADRFVALFELPIMNADFAERADTVSDYVNYRCASFWNRISFLNVLIGIFEEDMQEGNIPEIDKKIIKSIQREFKGLGDNVV